MDDFDQFRANLTYTRRFASVSSLPPLDMMYVDDAPNLLEVPDVCNVINVSNVTDVIEVTSILHITDVPNVTNVSDDSHDLSSTSEISQVTATGEQLTVSHNVDKEYDSNDPVLLSSSSSSFQVGHLANHFTPNSCVISTFMTCLPMTSYRHMFMKWKQR